MLPLVCAGGRAVCVYLFPSLSLSLSVVGGVVCCWLIPLFLFSRRWSLLTSFCWAVLPLASFRIGGGVLTSFVAAAAAGLPLFPCALFVHRI